MGKESCWEGNDREESSRMSSNVDTVEIVRISGKPIRQVANELRLRLDSGKLGTPGWDQPG